jgi:hypothetical protein
VSINVPSDKARAVVDAMERDMGTTLATKQDLLLIRQEVENRYELLSREIGSLRTETGKDVGSLRAAMGALRSTVEKDLGSLRADLDKGLDGLRKEFTAEFATVRKESAGEFALVRREMEALRLSMTLRLGSMLAAGVCVILAAMRLWM